MSTSNGPTGTSATRCLLATRRLVRSIIDPGPDAHKLLMSSTPDAESHSFVEELLEASSHTLAPRRQDVKQVLVEQLSAREMTVLRYLCSRLTYEEIAATLFVSLNTLKTHVKAVYRKLEVAYAPMPSAWDDHCTSSESASRCTSRSSRPRS